MAARRIRLDPDSRRRIVDSVLAGGYPHVAATAWGVPRRVLDAWQTRPPRGDAGAFVRELEEASARARLRAEMAVFEDPARIWLEHGPGRESAGTRGWSSHVQAAGLAAGGNPWLNAEFMSFVTWIMGLLEPMPDIRA